MGEKRMKLLLHNIKELFKAEPHYLIKCKQCGAVEEKAIGWDFQRCKCGHYLYDERMKE